MSAVIQQLQLLTAGHLPQATRRYVVRLAATEQELLAAFRLRFKVFNLELNEGLDSSYVDGCDQDFFDEICQHLIVEDTASGAIVGTYRMQTGPRAAQNHGYYSEREFDFSPYEPIRGEVLELGRACVHRDHRKFEVLNLLWKAIATYADEEGVRYLVGCSSLSSQDPALGIAMYQALSPYLVQESLRTNPHSAFACSSQERSLLANAVPARLLRAYLAIGAKICGPPAIDREFKTIDFLTLLDLHALPASVKARYLGRD